MADTPAPVAPFWKRIGHTSASPRFDHDDEVKLEHLGYKQARSCDGALVCASVVTLQQRTTLAHLAMLRQELRRGMGLLGSMGVTTGIIQPLLNGGARACFLRLVLANAVHMRVRAFARAGSTPQVTHSLCTPMEQVCS